MKQPILSFAGLLNAIVRQAPRPNPSHLPDKTQKLTTTIRLDGLVRSFYEAQAVNLGISIQECLSLTLHAVMRASYEPQATELERQADRFFELFAAHNIAMTDISVVTEEVSAIQREDLLNRAALLNKYNAPLIDHLSSIFDVSKDWLKGLPTHSHISAAALYKNPEGFARYLAYLKHHYRNIRVSFVLQDSQVERNVYKSLKQAAERGDDIAPVDVRIIIEKETYKEGLLYRTFEVLDEDLRWNYQNCRYDIKSVMRYLDQTRIFFDGIVLPENIYNSLFSGQALAASVLKGNYTNWHPDQLVWDDERNTELEELQSIKRHYLEQKMNECETAVRQSWQITDWDKFRAGEKIEDLIKDKSSLRNQ